MSDKQNRYSHVRVLQNNDARAVIHWRYALCEAEHYGLANVDPFTGWSDWTDEYYTIYPDGSAVREAALSEVRDAMAGGAAGLAIGRAVLEDPHPAEMASLISEVVHSGR